MHIFLCNECKKDENSKNKEQKNTKHNDFKTRSSAMVETARSLIHFRLTSSVIRKIIHNIAFLGHPMGSRIIGVSRMRNKNIQFGPYLWPNRQNSSIAKIAAQFSHGLVNSAMGQIPCSTERISS